MNDTTKSSSWWQTLPGIITALAALLTAVGGLLLALHQIGPTGRDGHEKTESVTATDKPPSGPAATTHRTNTSQGRGEPADESLRLLAIVRAALCPDKDKLQSIKAIQQNQTQVIMGTPEVKISMELVSVIGQKEMTRIRNEEGEIRHVATQSVGFVVMGTEVHDDDRWAQEKDLNGIKRNLFNILQNAGNPAFHFKNTGELEVQGVQTKVLEVDADGAALQWFVDSSSGRILRSTYWEESRKNQSQRVDIEYSDWRNIEGTTVPFKSVEFRDGKKMFEIDVAEMHFNPLVDSNLFAKP